MRPSSVLPLALTLLIAACGDSSPVSSDPEVTPAAVELTPPPVTEDPTPPEAPAPVAEAPSPAPDPGPATLQLSTNSLALFVTGMPRTITITNTSAVSADNVSFTTTPPVPAGTSISSTCGTLAASSSCQLTITPGANPSAAPGDTNPSAVVLSVQGDNTNTASVGVAVLAYGSVHQSGYLFSVDDTTATNTSIGGKVMALVDQAPVLPDGLIWSSDGSGGTFTSVDYTAIIGVSDTDTPGPNSCDGLHDGLCNTSRIVAHYDAGPSPVNPTYYAAGLCRATIAGFSDWYLPAQCELGETGSCAAGNQSIAEHLVDGSGVAALDGWYWSSTQSSTMSSDAALGWYLLPAASSPSLAFKDATFGVRCVRGLSR